MGETFNWGDLGVIIAQSPRTSAFYRAQVGPEEELWSLENQLLATLVDYMAVGNWQRGGGKKKDYPKPIQRPGVEAPKKFGKTVMTVDEVNDWLGADFAASLANK